MENELIKRVMNKDINAKLVAPLVLAYVGDTVFDLYVKTKIVTENNMKVNQLHRESTKYVKASAQAEIYKRLEPVLTEEEKTYFKKGRNAKSHTVPKNAKLIDYKYATGFETMLGYLYLDGQLDRVDEIINMAISGGNDGKDDE